MGKLFQITVEKEVLSGSLSRQCPNRAGLYYLNSSEIPDKWSPVAVYQINDILLVHTPDLGRMPVQMLHDGLTEPRWLKP